MKPITIDFLAARRTANVWLALATVGLLWSIGGGGRLWVAEASEDRVLNQLRTANAATPVAPALLQPDARESNSRRVAGMLSRDWNKLFSVLENVQVPETSLASVSIDGESGSVRVEFKLDSLATVSRVSRELNAGYDVLPWQFEGATGSQTGSARGQGTGASTGFHASWSTKLHKL